MYSKITLLFVLIKGFHSTLNYFSYFVKNFDSLIHPLELSLNYFSLVTKDDALSAFKRLAKIIQNEKNCTIVAIKIDHRGEFQNEKFEKL